MHSESQNIRRIFRTSNFLLACSMFATIGVTQAQTCENPLPLPENRTLGFDTCLATNSVSSVGPFASPGPDVVYAFRDVPWRPTHTSRIDVTSLDGQYVVLAALTKSSCRSSPTDAQDSSGDNIATLLSANQIGQQYFVIVTATPSAPLHDCGNVQIKRTTVP